MLTDRNAEELGPRLAQVLDAADKRIGKRPAGAAGAARYEREEASIRAFLKRFVDAMQARDGLALASMFAPDERTALIGIGDTVLLGAERISRRYLRSTEAVSELRAQLHEPHIFVLASGQSACVTARLDSDPLNQASGYQESYRNMRISMVLEKQGDSWWIVQLHYSDPREHKLLEG
jgi:ketosteroid isomerase-like protein